MLSPALQPLAGFDQWIGWRLEWNEARNKHDKIPYSPHTGYKASSTKPEDWSTYDEALAYAKQTGMDGVGFVFTGNDPFFFLDIDNAATADGGWSELAVSLLTNLKGAAVERSSSGTGLHVIGCYRAEPDHACVNSHYNLEFYTRERFVALTDDGTIGNVTHISDDALNSFIPTYFPPRTETPAFAEWTSEPVPEWHGPDDDLELLSRAWASGGKTAASVFNEKQTVRFIDLWTANPDVLGAAYPPKNQNDPFDRSEADMALASHLAFWTGKDNERTRRLMEMSELKRGKWKRGDNYLASTIQRTASNCLNVYNDGKQTVPVPPPANPDAIHEAGFTLRSGTIMPVDTQLEYFKGCIYINGINKIIDQAGRRFDKARFDIVYGGYEFIRDSTGRKPTPSAWDAFTMNQNYQPPIADKLCFRPELGCSNIIEENGLRLYNTYVPIEADRCEGDPAPMLDLLRRQIPNERDQMILLSYMARVVRSPGIKAQYWPVIQGVQGNGKSMWLLVMMHAIGLRYSHLPNMDKMVRQGMNFTGWIDCKLFLGLEEVHAANRREFFDSFKVVVTNRFMGIEFKSVEEATGDNRANGIICTNYKNGVPIDLNNRRYAIFFTAQQKREHKERDGLTPRYFRNLLDWLYGLNEYAAYGANYGLRVMCNYLHEYEILEEFDPARMATEAPNTTSTDEAINESRGRIEQEILEAIEQELPGFAGGWISSIKVNELLERNRLYIAPIKRREIMVSMGYDWHPALKHTKGRTNNIVRPDNGKPRLFCKKDSLPWMSFPTPTEAENAYSKAQDKALAALTRAQMRSGGSG